MTKVITEVDCGNSPKKQYILDFNIAFAKSDIETVLNMFDEKAVWDMVGDKTVTGIEDIKNYLLSMELTQAKELVLDNIISHGKTCSANGTIIYGKNKIAFCDVYTFCSHSKDAKVVRLKSYAIEL